MDIYCELIRPIVQKQRQERPGITKEEIFQSCVENSPSIWTSIPNFNEKIQAMIDLEFNREIIMDINIITENSVKSVVGIICKQYPDKTRTQIFSKIAGKYAKKEIKEQDWFFQNMELYKKNIDLFFAQKEAPINN